MNAITIGAAVIKFLPLISDTIKSIEQLDATPGKGAVRKEAVLIILKTVYEAENPNPAIPFDQLAASVEKTVDAIVGFYNSIGLFVKSVTNHGA